MRVLAIDEIDFVSGGQGSTGGSSSGGSSGGSGKPDSGGGARGEIVGALVSWITQKAGDALEQVRNTGDGNSMSEGEMPNYNNPPQG